MKLYHYTSLESFSKIWISKTLLFANSNMTNDIFERNKIISVENCLVPDNGESSKLDVQRHFVKMFWEELNKYKQISLIQDYKDGTKGYASPMMWGHYAQKGKGVCLGLDSDKIEFPECCIHKAVSYTAKIPRSNLDGGVDLHTRELIHNYIKENSDTIFFKKHIHWEYENEYRVISKNCAGLNIGNAITNVYVQYRSEDTECKIIRKLVEGSNVDISVILSYPSSYREIKSISISQLNKFYNKNR